MRGGRWTGWDPGQLLGRELAGSTIGIVGLGRIGSRVRSCCADSAPRLLYASRTPPARARVAARRSTAELEELVGAADVVTLHVPLSPRHTTWSTRTLLARFKPGSILVNTVRGALVDRTALAAALRSGRSAAAGLDVYEHEPQVPAELIALENVVLAPHIGSATATARDAMARLVAENVIAVLEGRSPVTPVGGPGTTDPAPSGPALAAPATNFLRFAKSVHVFV